MTKLLTKAVENQITQNWQVELPSLAIYRPRHLLRRVGPLLVGICLDRDSGGDIYKPIFHVHFLGIARKFVALTLGTQLRAVRSGGPDYVEVRWHEQKYRDVAARMRQQSLLPLEGDLELKQVLAAYRHFLATPMGAIQVAHLFSDMILLAAWAGDRAGAESLLAEVLQRAPGEPSFRQLGGTAAFEAECRCGIERPALIRDIIDAQVTALDAAQLPVSQLRT